MPAVRRKQKRAARESYSEKTLLKFVKEHLSKEYPNPRREGCPTQSNTETLGPRSPASRCFHRLPRFSLLPVLQDLQRFACPLESEPVTSTIAREPSRVPEARTEKNFISPLTFVDFFASL